MEFYWLRRNSNSSVGHAAGANLREGIGIIRYNKDRWRFKT